MSYDYSAYVGAAAAGADPYGAAAYGAAAPAYGAYAAAPAYGAYGAAPTYGAYAAAGAAGLSEEVRTIFITGFPEDVRERELNNLLRFLPGYEASQMNWNKGQAQGFALFTSGAYARTACDALQHVSFDERCTLRCEVARKNMYIKDDPNKRPRVGPLPTAGGYGYPPAPAAAGGYSAPPAPRAVGAGYSSGANQGDNPPCNTLFVGNLGDNVDENELRGLFSALPGFRNFKLMRSARAVSAFVEFETIETASAAHAAQQNAPLSTSERGGIRVQFSKNPFGKKRDITGQLIDTPLRIGEAGFPGAHSGGSGGGNGDLPPPPQHGGDGSGDGAGGPHKVEEYQPTSF